MDGAEWWVFTVRKVVATERMTMGLRMRWKGCEVVVLTVAVAAVMVMMMMMRRCVCSLESGVGRVR